MGPARLRVFSRDGPRIAHDLRPLRHAGLAGSLAISQQESIEGANDGALSVRPTAS